MTGYKLRRQISKALAWRSDAIRTALKNYNELAPLQDPPRPKIEYTDIASYVWLGEFELLKNSRHDILQKKWAAPVNREVMDKYFKLQCARVEIKRLNVEIPRLQAWVDDEDARILKTADNLAAANPLISMELRELYRERSRINNVIRNRLAQIYNLPGYTGRRVAIDGDFGGIVQVGSDDAVIFPDEDDQLNEEAVRLEETVSRIAR